VKFYLKPYSLQIRLLEALQIFHVRLKLFWLLAALTAVENNVGGIIQLWTILQESLDVGYDLDARVVEVVPFIVPLADSGVMPTVISTLMDSNRAEFVFSRFAFTILDVLSNVKLERDFDGNLFTRSLVALQADDEIVWASKNLRLCGKADSLIAYLTLPRGFGLLFHAEFLQTFIEFDITDV